MDVTEQRVSSQVKAAGASPNPTPPHYLTAAPALPNPFPRSLVKRTKLENNTVQLTNTITCRLHLAVAIKAPPRSEDGVSRPITTRMRPIVAAR
ncbi:hypothetical protein EYF80_005993 [Liparis tanakae]|uniref:Uncharacterized protein n=1 Tax=Liparis tanakae TaxID=230148 RepID=A0A4Z2J1A9_9TELE|nr:hypothetical protein EYF80_005993 [Liparis tanakae]